MSQVTIRRSLLKSLSLLVILTAGGILAVTLIGGFGAVDDLSKEQIERTTTRVDAELDLFFGQVRAQTLTFRDWLEAGVIDVHEVDRLNALFVPILDQNDYLSSLMVATSEGEEYMILRDPVERTRWSNRIVRKTRSGLEVTLREWDFSSGEAEEYVADIDYDPRRRLWYNDAMKATDEEPVYWTRPAIFFVTKDPGVTATTQSATSADSSSSVIAVDLLLMDVSRYIGELEVSEHGRAFVLFEEPTAKGLKVMAFPADSESYTDQDIRRVLSGINDSTSLDAVPELPGISGFTVPLIDAAADRWSGMGRDSGVVSFDHDGKTWWTGFHPYSLGENRLWIGVAVPETDFLGDVERRAIIIAIAAFAALIVAALMSILLAKNYSEPLEKLAVSSRKLGNLDLTSTPGVSTHLKEVEQLAMEQERMRITLDSFSRYVPVELVRELLATGEAAKIGGTRRVITALFTDIVGFTTISEALGPEKLTVHMAEYFETVLEIIQGHSGDVNQLLGDGVLAYWGAPKIDPDHARHAVEAILMCHSRLQALNMDWRERGLPSLPTRYGLASGEVMVGNVGSKSRLAYAAVGDNVNLASRLEGLTRFYDAVALTSGSVKELAGPGFEWMHIDTVRVKGKTEAIELYEPLGHEGMVDAERLAFRDLFEKAREHYLHREFAETVRLLSDLPEATRTMGMVVRLHDAASGFLTERPDADWDGVTNFKVK